MSRFLVSEEQLFEDPIKLDKMPQTKKVRSLQYYCLEIVTSKIDEWCQSQTNVEVFEDQKANLDANGSFDSLCEYC